MEKRLIDFTVVESLKFSDSFARINLRPNSTFDLAGIKPGQFVEISVAQSHTLLRRPISVHDVDVANNTLSLFVRNAGDATKCLIDSKPGDVYSIVLPLGNGFPVDDLQAKSVLLIGGGVGIAPLLYYAKTLNHNNITVNMAFGAQTASMLYQKEMFEQLGNVSYATDDGSLGVKGLVTQLLDGDDCDVWCVCGPMPMMKAVARIARAKNKPCYVSLENTMACGLGACLCCVEKTVRGNRCVCTDGPVFEISELTWQ